MQLYKSNLLETNDYITSLEADFHSTMMKFDSKILLILLVLFLGNFSAKICKAGPADDLYEQGFHLSIEGKTQGAVQAYLHALKAKPDSAEIHHALGVLFFESGSGIQAIDHFRKAELFYKKRNDEQANRNLAIVKQNLVKAYRKLGLTPQDFGFRPSPSAEDKWKPSGVGFLIGKQGNLFTSSYSIKDAKKIRVRFSNGQTVPAELIRNFIIYKISILKLIDPAKNPLHPLSFADNPLFKKGDSVYAMDFSNLATLNPPLSQGRILIENAVENSDKVFQLDLELKEGQSGGPLFNRDGKVVGMALTKDVAQKSFSYLKGTSKETSFAIKSSYLKKILSDLPRDRNQGKSSPKDASLNPGINVNNVSKEFIHNFISLEISD